MKLSVELEKWRADRPDEWKMDEFIRKAAELEREKADLVAQVESLKGIKPEMPPRPQQGCGLPRYGIKWNGDHQPISTPMDDGYWTPYHLVEQCLNQIKAEAVSDAVRHCNHYLAFPVSRGSVADAVIAVDEINQYAASIAKGE